MPLFIESLHGTGVTGLRRGLTATAFFYPLGSILFTKMPRRGLLGNLASGITFSRKLAASFSGWHHAFSEANLPAKETRSIPMSEDPNQQDADVEETPAARREARTRRASNGGGGSTADEPDVLLDVSELEVDRIRLEVENLRAHVSVLAQLDNLVSLSVGVDARLDRVELVIEGVRAKVLLKVRLEHIRAILEKALDTVAKVPEILERLGQTLDELLEGRLGVRGKARGCS